jgi:hypothetical protein
MPRVASWPGNGVWFHLVPDADFGYGPFNAGDIFVYCGYACVEWSQRNITQEGWYQDPVSHNNYQQTPEWFGDMVYCCSADGSNWWNYFGGNLHAAWDCNDARSALDQEYVDTYSGGSMYFSYGLLPHCTWVDGDFNSSGGSTNFSWDELNGHFRSGNPNYPWGIVRTSLVVGLEATRTDYNSRGITLSSGYRTPSGNAIQPQSVFASYHVYGRAADMCSSDICASRGCANWTVDEFNVLRQAAANTGNTVELLFYHVHRSSSSRGVVGGKP